jgi:RNA polymerase sigma-70 factor (ECF subfamily)
VPVTPLAVDDLYRAHRPGLLRYLRRYMSSDHAVDMVQQIFVRFSGLGHDRLAQIDNPAGYLRRSAANLAADHARSERRRSADHHVSLDEVDLRAPDQVAALEARDMLRRLEQAVQRLKPRTREIFLAHRIDGYSYVEIAAITGLSVKGVEKHMSRAIAFIDRVSSAR